MFATVAVGMAVSAAGVVLAQGRAEIYVTVVNEDRRPVRGLGSEDYAQAQGRERREHDAGKLGRRGRALAYLEPVGGRVAALTRQVPDGESDQ